MFNALAWLRRRLVSASLRPTPGRVAVAVFVVSLIIFARITPHFIGKMAYPTGDEPYYLLAAHSLIHDHDFDLQNNFDNQDYWHYYPGELYPRHESKTIIPGLFSKHSLGVSLLIVPAYALNDWRGTVYFFNILGALLAANIYLLAYEVSRRHWVALLLWLTLSFTNPLMSYTFLIFPALVSALLVVYVYRRIRLDNVAAPLTANGIARMFAIGFSLGLLPWLHPRFLPVSFSLFAYLLWREIRARRRRSPDAQNAAIVQGHPLALRWLAFFLPAAVWAVGFLAYYWVLYGTFMPNYGDHAGMGKPEEWVVAFFGGFLDRQWGFFIHAPVYILAIVGIILMLKVKERWAELAWLAIIALPYSVIILTYKQWWGEWCPAARYWVSLVPLLAVPLAYLLSAPLRRGFAVLYLVLAGISWAIMAAFMRDPHLMYNHPTGKSSLLEWVATTYHLPSLLPLFPTYFVEDWSNVWLTILWTELVIVIVWIGWKLVKRPAP